MIVELLSERISKNQISSSKSILSSSFVEMMLFIDTLHTGEEISSSLSAGPYRSEVMSMNSSGVSSSGLLVAHFSGNTRPSVRSSSNSNVSRLLAS